MERLVGKYCFLYMCNAKAANLQSTHTHTQTLECGRTEEDDLTQRSYIEIYGMTLAVPASGTADPRRLLLRGPAHRSKEIGVDP